MSALLCLAALKSLALAGSALAAVHWLPARWVRPRRIIALGVVWALLILPWLALRMHTPEVLPAPVFIPVSTPWLPAIWVAGTFIMTVRLLAEWLRWRQIIQQGIRMPRDSHDLPVIVTKDVAGPCLAGAFRPRILIPASALDWPLPHWQAALRHEAQHARQHDGLHRWVSTWARALFWWNPLVHALCRRLEIESELACDAAAVGTTCPRAYGRLLLALATDAAPMQTAVAWSARHSLRERLERLITPPPCGRASAIIRASLVTLLLATTALAALAMRSREITPDEVTVRLAADPFPNR